MGRVELFELRTGGEIFSPRACEERVLCWTKKELNEGFLKDAEVIDVEKGYIRAPGFNISVDPDVRFQTSLILERRLRERIDVGKIDAVYGVPRAGTRVAPSLAIGLHLTDGPSCKGTVPGGWRNVLTVETGSFTTTDPVTQLHFGDMTAGKRILLVEDVIARGNTLKDCIEQMRERGVEVLAAAAMFVKLFQGGVGRIEKLGVSVVSVVQITGITDRGVIVLAE